MTGNDDSGESIFDQLFDVCQLRKARAIPYDATIAIAPPDHAFADYNAAKAEYDRQRRLWSEANHSYNKNWLNKITKAERPTHPSLSVEEPEPVHIPGWTIGRWADGLALGADGRLWRQQIHHYEEYRSDGGGGSWTETLKYAQVGNPDFGVDVDQLVAQMTPDSEVPADLAAELHEAETELRVREQELLEARQAATLAQERVDQAKKGF